MSLDDPFVATLQEWTEVFMRRSMRNFFLYSKENGLSVSQIGALFLIYRRALGVSDLAEQLGITSAAASQMLDRLVQLELILRSEDLHDRRVKNIVLTDKGRQTLTDSIRARQGWLHDLAKTLSRDEKEHIAAGLKILIGKTNLLEEHIAPTR
ncbi:MAG: MarR family transcriptional regulator [Anaerolineales bacterium]|jgi:DNA-binding MarR family transcriptional regulator